MTASTTQTRIAKVFAATVAASLAPIEYKVDGKGRKVRVPNAARPITYEEVRSMLLNNRILSVEEVLEAVGPSTMKFMLSVGQLVRCKDTKDAFWISKKAADHYKLPAFLGPKTYAV